MRCTRCGEAEAAYLFTVMPPGGHEPEDHRLCRKCAAEKSPYVAKTVKAIPVAEFLEKLLTEHALKEGGGAAAAKAAPIPEVPRCAHCGLPFATYRATLLLGCPECYDAFGEHLLADIRKFQGGADNHRVLAAPAQRETVVERQSRLAAMRAELNECIENEDFDRAAFLRDEIKRLMEAQATAGKAPAES